MVFYEAARRLADTIAAMIAAFGDSRSAAVVREISKTYEETVRGTLLDLERRFRATPALGEITIIVAGAENATAAVSDGVPITIEVPIAVEALREAGLSLKQASAVVAKLSGRARREVYQDVLKSREDDDSTDD
jgi:16S rRNA (cytidine1402-2'-O)-methyltransferase